MPRRYRRLGLFPPCYDPKQVDNSRFRSSSPVEGWYQPDYGLAAAREKEEEGEEKVEPGDPAPLSLDDLEPSLPSLAGRCRRGEGSISIVIDRYRAVTVDLDRRRSISTGISPGRKKKREKKRENLEIQCCSPNLDPRLQASRPFAGRIFDDRGEKKMTFLLPAQASRRGFAEDFFS
ncbi:hypothetical protein BHE74_00036112 [Ensete ventricosum]|nr:hypothetical protein BHE74_00036112 [Ensete ventricosum]